MHTSTIRVNIGPHALDLVYRVYSSDLAVIKQTFEQEEGALHKLQRWPEIQAWLAAQTKPPLIVDCGAYIGTTALYYSVAYPTAKIVALEPDAENYHLLQTNVKNTSIMPLIMGVSGKNIKSMRIERDAAHASRTRTFTDSSDAATVVATTIDALYKSSPDCVPFIVKMDIEGTEFDVFNDMANWIDRTPIIVMEPHDWLYPKQGLAGPFLRAMAFRSRDFIISGEYIISIVHELP